MTYIKNNSLYGYSKEIIEYVALVIQKIWPLCMCVANYPVMMMMNDSKILCGSFN